MMNKLLKFRMNKKSYGSSVQNELYINQ